MEADERTMDLLASGPPSLPAAPPPSRNNSRENANLSNPVSSAPPNSSRTWRRRPDDEIPRMHQIATQALQRQYQAGAPLHANNDAPHVAAAIPEEEVHGVESSSGVVGSPATVNTRLSSPDIEQVSTTSGGTSWSLRIPWLRQKRSGGTRYDIDATDGLGSPLSFGESENSYYRDVMNAYDFMNMHEIVGNESVHDGVGDGGFTGASSAEIPRRYSRGTNSVVSSSSHLTSVPSSVSVSSDGDLKEADWTPPDSSYGAACPICGSVPKKIRRGVEFTMLGLVVLSIMYLVVTTSIRITNDHSTHSGSDADVDLDDDFYVAWDDRVYNDDEDLEGNDDDMVSDEDGDGERYLRMRLVGKANEGQELWGFIPWV